MTDEKTQSNIVSADIKFKYKTLKQIVVFSGAVSLVAIGSFAPGTPILPLIVGTLILFFVDWN